MQSSDALADEDLAKLSDSLKALADAAGTLADALADAAGTLADALDGGASG